MNIPGMKRELKDYLRVASLLACAAFLLGRPARAQETEVEAHKLFYFGLYQEIGMGDLKGAIETYSRITGGDKVTGRALYRKGRCYEKSGKDSLAINCFSRAIANYPGMPDIRDKALEGKLRLGSQSTSAYVNEGVRRDERGDFAGAKDMFQRALLMEPDNPFVHLQMASACRKLALRENSLSHLEVAIRHYEDAAAESEFRTDLAINRELGECYAKAGRTEEAIKLWQTYLRTRNLEEPDRRMANYELELLREASDYFRKRDISRKMKDYLSEAEELTRNGDPSRAAKIYLQAKKEFPQSYIPPYRLAVLYELFLEKPDVAIRYYREALVQAPQITAQRIRCKMAVLYYEIGDLDASVAYIDQCISRDIRFVERELELKARRIKTEKTNLDRIRKEEEERKRALKMLERKQREEMRERQILEQIRQKGKPKKEIQE